MNEPTNHPDPIGSLVDRLVRSVVGHDRRAAVDLEDVTEIAPDVLGIGDPKQDGCVTVDSSDTVTIWKGGDEAAVAGVTGAYEHYRAIARRAARARALERQAHDEDGGAR